MLIRDVATWSVGANVPSHFSCIPLFAAPWTVACQAPLSMGFSRQEYWIRLPCPPLGDLPNPGIHPVSPELAGRFFTTSTTWEAPHGVKVAQLCRTLCDPMDCSTPGSFVHADSQGKNTGEGRYALLHGMFPTQGLSPGLPHCRQILYHLSHQGSPRILEW